MKYLLVECATKDLLEAQVNEFLRMGYTCQGGVSVSQCFVSKGGKRYYVELLLFSTCEDALCAGDVVRNSYRLDTVNSAYNHYLGIMVG